MGIDELIAPKREQLLELARRYGVSDLRVFGSVARGEAGPDSDVDFLITLPSTMSLDFFDLRDDLASILGRNVDLLTEKSLHWFIKDRVLREAVPV
jgi:predicted nucleotidyltransferase